jgi:single-strand DNA-binding protein
LYHGNHIDHVPAVLIAAGYKILEVVMNSLNSIIIEGNMVRDPLLRSTAKGTALCTFTIASNRYYKQDSNLENEVSFFDVESWAKLAESCHDLGHKGRGIKVVGRLKQSRWSDPDGKPHSRVSIVAEHVEFRPEFKRGVSAEDGPPEAAVSDTTVIEDIEELSAVTF